MTHVATEIQPMGRLQLCPRMSVEGAVDGAWWPRSTDLGDELPDLIAVFGSVDRPGATGGLRRKHVGLRAVTRDPGHDRHSG